MDTSQIAIALAVGYAFGSIPFGLLLTRLAGAGDIRSLGSGNIGATNVLRTGRKGLAAGTLLGDMFKGAAAVLLMQSLGGTDAGLIAALGAVHEPHQRGQRRKQQCGFAADQKREQHRGERAGDQAGQRRIPRRPCDHGPDRAEEERHHPRHCNQDADVGGDAFAALELQPDWIDVA